MRNNIKLQWFSITVFFTIILGGSLLLKKDDTTFTKTTSRPKNNMDASVANSKHVTKSMAQLGRMDEINKHLLFLNYVPKSGSEILILLLQKLQGFNNYRHVRLKGGNKRLLSNLQQEYLVYEIYDTMKATAVPISLDRSVFFINFTQFDRQFPTYVNLLRHPVDKIISRSTNKDITKDYYYKCLLNKRNGCNFKNGQPYELSIPYFCGHDRRCMLLNNNWALQQAKRNVEAYFPVVGVLEELNATLEILENKIPYFFKGGQHLYQQEYLNLESNKKTFNAPKMVTRKLEDTLVNEIDFYQWIRSRLFQQLQVLYGDHRH